jgi:hypothetical protein
MIERKGMIYMKKIIIGSIIFTILISALATYTYAQGTVSKEKTVWENIADFFNWSQKPGDVSTVPTVQTGPDWHWYWPPSWPVFNQSTNAPAVDVANQRSMKPSGA